VIAGSGLITGGYLASIASRVVTSDFNWVETEIVALACGVIALGLAIRGRVRAAGALAIIVVWAELHVSMLFADPSSAIFSGLAVFPLLVVGAGLFFGGPVAMTVAVVSSATAPLAIVGAYARHDIATSVIPFPIHAVTILAVCMIGAAMLVWIGVQSFATVQRAREAEARKYALLVDSAPYGIVLVNQAGRVEALNPAAETLLRRPAPDVLGRPFGEVLGPVAAQIEQVLAPADDRTQADVTLSHADGQRFVEASGSRTVLGDGTDGVLILLRDVTERREVERRAVQLGRMLDQAPFEVYVFDGDTLRIRFANSGARRNLGYDAAAVPSLTVTDMMPTLTRSDVRGLVTDLSSQASHTVPLVGRHHRRDGSNYPVEGAFHLVSFDGESAVAYFATDVSERAAAEEEQERLRARVRLAERFEAIQQLAGGISHEFNNLLMSVGGHAEMIAEFADEERVRGWAARIQVAQKRGANLIRRLQGLARTEVAQPQPLSVKDTLAEFLPVLDRTLGPTVRVTLEAAGYDVVLMDRAQLEQVVLHLATNARDAMPEGGVVAITINGPDGSEGEVELAVRDTGRGMTPDVAQRAFDPFFSAKPRGEATGLGLTTVRSILTQVGGHIELDSRPSAGTVARVRLAVTAQQPHAPRRTPEGVTIPMVAGASGDILVVDDEPDARAVVTHALTRAGYQVRSVGTAEEGLAWLTERHGDVDLVLTDIALPGMTGFALGAEVQARYAALRVLYMSGYAADHVAGAPPGFDAVSELLVKPFSTERLLATVRFALERRGREPSVSERPADG